MVQYFLSCTLAMQLIYFRFVHGYMRWPKSPKCTLLNPEYVELKKESRVDHVNEYQFKLQSAKMTFVTSTIKGGAL